MLPLLKSWLCTRDGINQALRQLLGISGWNDFSRGSNSIRNSVGWVLKTDWGKKRLRVDTLYPQSEGFLLLYIFGILRVSLLTFGFSINSTILVLWNLTVLSAKFQRTFQESEIWTLMKRPSLLGIHSSSFLSCTPCSVHSASQQGPPGGNIGSLSFFCCYWIFSPS